MERRHFRRFEKPTFKCAICTRNTRNPDHGGTELCRQCHDLTGLDNAVNDNGLELTPNIIAKRDGLFEEAVKKGGNGEHIKNCNSFLWPK